MTSADARDGSAERRLPSAARDHTETPTLVAYRYVETRMWGRERERGGTYRGGTAWVGPGASCNGGIRALNPNGTQLV